MADTIGGGKFLERGKESDRDEWTLYELNSGSVHYPFFFGFLSARHRSASRDFLEHVNGMLYSP